MYVASQMLKYIALFLFSDYDCVGSFKKIQKVHSVVKKKDRKKHIPINLEEIILNIEAYFSYLFPFIVKMKHIFYNIFPAFDFKFVSLYDFN